MIDRSVGGAARRIGTAAALALGAAAALAAGAQAQTSVTIYNDGRVLVRRTVAADIPRGVSTQRLPLGRLDPATLFSLDPEVTLAGVSYDAAVDEASVLRRAIGRRIRFRQTGTALDSLGATLVGVDPERWRMPDGGIFIGRPGAPVFPEELVVVEPVAAVTLRSDAPRKQLRLGYFTGGASWQASYQAVLGNGEARLTGAAVVYSESLRADDAEVQLLAGSVGRAAPPPEIPRPMMAKGRAEEFADAQSAAVGMANQRVGEFHLYTLPGRSTIAPGATTSIALFEPARLEYERSYVVRGGIPYWGILPPQGEEVELPVEISYLVKRPRGTEAGDRPLPGGVVRLFQADGAGRQQLIGEAHLDHSPAGKDLRLAAGIAFDLTARRVQTSYTTRRDSVRAGSWRTTALADYGVTLRNATDSTVTIDVLEERGGEWSVISSSVPAEKLSSTVTRFRVAVPPRGETVLKYRVRVIW
ncbi:MAG TPA: hypothetical protein VNK43_04280 [Gemmatimonadales bacterium]|nr:hypothetical protein [Gemmatimonadales bacterium]